MVKPGFTSVKARKPRHLQLVKSEDGNLPDVFENHNENCFFFQLGDPNEPDFFWDPFEYNIYAVLRKYLLDQ